MNRFIPLAGLILFAALAATSPALEAQEKRVAPIVPQADGFAPSAPSLPRKVGERFQEHPEAPELEALRELNSKTDIRVERMPLDEFLQLLSKRHKIRFQLDRAVLRRANVAPNTPITASFVQVRLALALRRILRPLKLEARVVNGVVVITETQPQPPIQMMRVEGGRRVFVRAQAIGEGIGVLQRQQQIQQQQIQQHLQSLLPVELVFVKKICAPTPAQMRQLKQDAHEYLEVAAQNSFAAQRRGAQMNQDQLSNASKFLQEALVHSVETRVSREQAARYRSELEKRSANRREVCARNLAALLDQELCLSAPQREEVRAALLANWNDSWCSMVQMAAINGQNYVPSVPYEVIAPHLDAAQVDLWEGLQKIGGVNWGIQTNLFGLPTVELDDE
jgi:hypothetical protein